MAGWAAELGADFAGGGGPLQAYPPSESALPLSELPLEGGACPEGGGWEGGGSVGEKRQGVFLEGGACPEAGAWEGGGSVGEKRQRVCVYFARGKCRYGDSCHFAHVKSEAPNKKSRSEQAWRKKRKTGLCTALGLHAYYES